MQKVNYFNVYNTFTKLLAFKVESRTTVTGVPTVRGPSFL